jgi:hypothetical protein
MLYARDNAFEWDRFMVQCDTCGSQIVDGVCDVCASQEERENCDCEATTGSAVPTHPVEPIFTVS